MPKANRVWAPFPGAQKRFMTCPAWECLLHGNRGGGKTDVLLMDFAQGVGVGYGADYRGLLLREATTERFTGSSEDGERIRLSAPTK